ncbi:Plasmodium exported protein, unknown function [Plasmodium vivax]|uniref:Variable surface protein Vir35 n=1 Tax=Plasmodium vivax TaxID=5855 RepID=A0A1G4GT56_PLAVI|nr:Plasmodium exported protein, unknown function [Plasmodium vivax]
MEKMASRKNNFLAYVNIRVMLKITTFVILTWICHFCSEQGLNDNTLDKAYSLHGKFEIRTHRLLSKYEMQKELVSRELRTNLPYKGMNNKINNGPENISSSFTQLKRDRSNNFDSYMKGYNRRYAKMKGLSKLDCYFEKKVFDKMDNIYEFARSMNNPKRSFMKKFFHKYGIRLILILLPFLVGLIFPMLFIDKHQLIKICESTCNKHNREDRPNYNEEHANSHYLSTISNNTFDIITHLYTAFFCIACILFLSVIIYSFIKIVKYDKLKSGKGKIIL